MLASLFTFIGSSAHAQETDLDALMARALERRNETWRVLHDYVLDERERFALEGPSDVRLFGSDRQYTWYVQDGILVRSPVRFNGVAVPDADRREYEARWLARTSWAVVVLACLFTFIGSRAHAQESDLDALMARCLERRNETWRVLHDYVLDERERFALVGPSDVRLFGSDQQYTWYVQDGILVRSPVRFNGVAVPDADRREYEARWLNEERSRAERAQKQ